MSIKSVKVLQDENGVIKAVDKEGTVVWTEALSAKNRAKLEAGLPVRRQSKRQVKYVYVRNQVGELVLVPAGYDLDKLPVLKRGSNELLIEINTLLCSQISLLVAHGYTLKEIAAIDGMPNIFTICHFEKINPEFKAQMKEARHARAEYYHDNVHEIAHTAKESTAKSDKVKLDSFKYLASVNDPDRFGNRTKIVGDPDAPISFVVDTGIRREQPEQDAIPTESTVIDEKPSED